MRRFHFEPAAYYLSAPTGDRENKHESSPTSPRDTRAENRGRDVEDGVLDRAMHDFLGQDSKGNEKIEIRIELARMTLFSGGQLAAGSGGFPCFLGADSGFS